MEQQFVVRINEHSFSIMYGELTEEEDMGLPTNSVYSTRSSSFQDRTC